jgi:GNAT superfamily N-acetyltransferase
MPESEAWKHYCQGFARAQDPWPELPLPAEPELAWWQAILAKQEHAGEPLLDHLRRALPQLRLPQVEGISRTDLYRNTVLRGATAAEAADNAGREPPPSWQEPDALRLWMSDHPCGGMPVLQTGCRRDFEQLVRALAHRCEPVKLPHGVHAQAVSGLIHWGLIQCYGRNSRARLIVLHEAPYGSVEAEQVPGQLPAEAWLKASTTLRLEHELTHLATKRLLGEMRLNLLDELIADAMGMVAALGRFDAQLFGRCLGLNGNDEPIPGGRWLSYTRELSAADTRRAVTLVMARARELEQQLNQQPAWLAPEQRMGLLRWLCRQRLDHPLQGEGVVSTSGAGIRWLSVAEALHFAHLTTPVMGHGLAALSTCPDSNQLCAAGQTFAGLPASLAVGRLTSRGDLEILSLVVAEPFRRLGLATQLLAWLEAEAKRLGKPTMVLTYPLHQPGSEAMARLTAPQRGWVHNPGLRLVHLDRAGGERLLERLTPVVARWSTAERYRLMPWSALDANLQHQLDQRPHVPTWARPLSGQVDGPLGTCETCISQALLDRNDIIGWLLADRVGEALLRINSWWMESSHQGSGLALLLLHRALTLTLAAQPVIRGGSFGVSAENRRMLALSHRCLEPLATRTVNTQVAKLKLGEHKA